MRPARRDDGFALITAIMMLFVLTGLGMGLLLLTDNQQRASAKEQYAESAFDVADTALNAQIGQLARSWPGTAKIAELNPSHCTAATTSTTNDCPSGASLSASFPVNNSTSCAPGQTDPWGSSTSNTWTTYVRDDGPLNGPATTIFNSSAVSGFPNWDANGDGKVWVRSVGVVNCRLVSVLSLVTEQIISTPFPESAVAGNWFETSNNGNKIIINTQGESSQAGGISMRCGGRTASNCEEYRPGQIEPNTTGAPPLPSPTLSASQLEAVKYAAKAGGTYYASGTCPGSLEEVSGDPVYVEGPCNLSYTGGSGNSPTLLGFLVIVNGTLTLGGNSLFYGTIYAPNQQESSGVVVSLQGSAKVTGSIIVDGNGGISFGSSGKGGGTKENFIYNGSAAQEFKVFAGAAGTRNSFRVLPANQ